MTNFNAILDDFDKTLQQLNLPNYERLQPPLPDSEIEEILKSIGIDDPDVFSLYKWKNGVSDLSEPAMIFAFELSMLSLETILNLKKSNNLQIKDIDELVILFDNSEDCLLYNTKPGRNNQKLHLYSTSLLSIDPPLPYFDSLSSMFKTTIEQYLTGGLLLNTKNNFLISNTQINIEVYNKLNPLCDFYSQEHW